MMKQIRIDSPCPVQLFRMKKNGNNYFCKSCCNTVVDFRSKTKAEIAEMAGNNTCGIFNNDQLVTPPKLKGFRKMVFYTMAMASVLGFNVSPVNAQTIDSTEVVQTENTLAKVKSANKKTDQKAYRKSKRRHPFRRKRKHSTIGRTITCPDF